MEWFNAVDATYRSDLRELNELNFERFDAKLEQRFAEQDAKWERRFAGQDNKWDRRFVELRAEMQVGLQRLETRLIKYLFGFWIAQAATTVGLVFGVVKLLH